MTSESVHMPVSIGCATVAEKNHDLVQAFRIKTPEVPHHGRAFQVSFRITFLRMDEIREFFGILDEENRCVVSDQIPVAFLGIELYSKSSGISLGVCTAFFSTNC